MPEFIFGFITDRAVLGLRLNNRSAWLTPAGACGVRWSILIHKEKPFHFSFYCTSVITSFLLCILECLHHSFSSTIGRRVIRRWRDMPNCISSCKRYKLCTVKQLPLALTSTLGIPCIAKLCLIFSMVVELVDIVLTYVILIVIICYICYMQLWKFHAHGICCDCAVSVNFWHAHGIAVSAVSGMSSVPWVPCVCRERMTCAVIREWTVNRNPVNRRRFGYGCNRNRTKIFRITESFGYG